MLKKELSKEAVSNFESKFSKYGSIQNYLSGVDLANAVFLVGEDVITADNLYSIISKQKDCTVRCLSTIYRELSKFGYNLYLNEYVESRGGYESINSSSAITNAVSGANANSEHHHILDYVQFYTENLSGQDLDEKLSREYICSVISHLNKNSVTTKDLIRSYYSLAFYNNQGLLNRRRINMTVLEGGGVYLSLFDNSVNLTLPPATMINYNGTTVSKYALDITNPRVMNFLNKFENEYYTLAGNRFDPKVYGGIDDTIGKWVILVGGGYMDIKDAVDAMRWDTPGAYTDEVVRCSKEGSEPNLKKMYEDRKRLYNPATNKIKDIVSLMNRMV